MKRSKSCRKQIQQQHWRVLYYRRKKRGNSFILFHLMYTPSDVDPSNFKLVQLDSRLFHAASVSLDFRHFIFFFLQIVLYIDGLNLYIKILFAFSSVFDMGYIHPCNMPEPRPNDLNLFDEKELCISFYIMIPPIHFEGTALLYIEK